jgi:hypothetical protein
VGSPANNFAGTFSGEVLPDRTRSQFEKLPPAPPASARSPGPEASGGSRPRHHGRRRPSPNSCSPGDEPDLEVLAGYGLTHGARQAANVATVVLHYKRPGSILGALRGGPHRTAAYRLESGTVRGPAALQKQPEALQSRGQPTNVCEGLTNVLCDGDATLSEALSLRAAALPGAGARVRELAFEFLSRSSEWPNC